MASLELRGAQSEYESSVRALQEAEVAASAGAAEHKRVRDEVSRAALAFEACKKNLLKVARLEGTGAAAGS